MTSANSADSAPTTPTTPAPDALMCCRKPLSTIAVTTRGASLTLRSCTSCGRHVWEKDGVVADRAELLDGVKSFLEQPREIVRRRSPRRSADGSSAKR
jgi:hypothetical protein